MSFSSETKQGIMRSPQEKDCCKLAELAAFMFSSGALLFEGKGKFTAKLGFESPALARRAFSSIRKLYTTSPIIKCVKHRRFGGSYQYNLHIGNANANPLFIALKMVDYSGNFISMFPQYAPQKPCDKRAFLKAAFLSAGSIQNPNLGYHLEIVSQSEQFLKIISRLSRSFGINFKKFERRESQVLYLKKATEISEFLAVIGADEAMMKFEDTVIQKQVMNGINRALNCDASNINKTLQAAQNQVEQIQFLLQKNLLDDTLLPIAQLRLNNPEFSLEELGQLYTPPLSKSGVNHKMRKIKMLFEKHTSI